MESSSKVLVIDRKLPASAQSGIGESFPRRQIAMGSGKMERISLEGFIFLNRNLIGFLSELS